MKRTVCIAVLIMAAVWVQAQKVTFYSPEFEEGVRQHIGLTAGANVLQTQTDTITCLDLSGLDITDIRDAVYLTAVTRLDLSYNSITDVSPLLPLESLRELNLSNNKLEDISILAFVQAESLEVDVTCNYISDFSYFYSPGLCDFTFLGMGMQLEKDAPYFDVFQFYADVDDDGQQVVSYRGYTNMPVSFSIGGEVSQESVQLDGGTYLLRIPEDIKETVEVALTNGEQSEKTYVVPPARYSVDAGKTIVLTTGLPEDYSLSYARASTGTVNIVGNAIEYTAPDEIVSDVVDFSYYQGTTLKGYSRYYVRKLRKGNANGDNEVDAKDIVEVVNSIMGKSSANFDGQAADTNDDNLHNITDIIQIVNIIIGEP